MITGAFGAALDPADLATVGLLPPESAGVSRFEADGVLAGLIRGATREKGLAEFDQLATRLQVIPLSGTPLFEELFVTHLNFPE